MKASRWAIVYLLLVVSGGAILAADTVFDFTVLAGDYTVPFGLMTGFSLLIGSITLLVEAADRRRTRVIGWGGTIAGFVLILVVDGFVERGPFIYYAGIGVLVLTGIALFSIIVDTDQQGAKA